MMQKLGDIATYINGYAFKPADRGLKGLPIIRIQDLTGNSYDLGFYDGIYPKKIEINNGDILISWSGSLGIFLWNGGKALLNQHIFKVVFDKKDIDKHYFLFAVKEKLNEMSLKTHGATMKHIIKSDFENITISLPDLNEQKRISNMLLKIENLIKMRKNQIQHYDTLTKSLFIERFGDVENNPKGIRVMKWNDVFLTKTGKLDSNAMVEGGQYPFFTCAKEAYWIDKYAFDCEALLLAGNNAVGVYDVKHYKGKFNAYQRTYVLQLKDDSWSYEFFKNQLELKLEYLRVNSIGSNTRYLTMKILGEIAFLVPDTVKQK